MRVAILSDTHFPGRGSALPAPCLAVVGRSDLVIHAGDLADLPTLTMLRALGKPLVAVHGNADDDAVRRALPASAAVELPGMTLTVVHNGGPEAGRLARMRRKYPGCGGVVFGHSHIPLHAGADGFFILNPGSATDRRRQPRHSMVEMVVTAGTPPEVTFVDLDDPEGGPLPDELIRRVG